MLPTIILKKGKEANAMFRHPWLFSGALDRERGEPQHGDLVQVEDFQGNFLGVGTYSATSSITVRLFSFVEGEIDQAWFVRKFRAADERRKLLGLVIDNVPCAYRVVFGEADSVPGLVVDRYADVLVVQISTAGMERLRPVMVAALVEVFAPRCIYERSDLQVRKEEGLTETVGVLYGDEPAPVEFVEDGMHFVSNVVHGQKTGFFLDQRPLRQLIKKLAAGRRALNLFSYTGAAGIAAIKSEAASVVNVDLSASALKVAEQQATLNNISADIFTTQEVDVFQFFSKDREPQYDLVIMDPPALIKSARDVEAGCKAYHFLNRAAMQLVEDGGIFITSSCSHFLSEDDLAFILRRASVQSGIRLDVLAVVHQSADHPSSIYFPESTYLKSFVCRVSR